MHQLSKNLDELKQLDNWVCYQLKPRSDGHMSKLPISPITRKGAAADTPETWSSYEKAVQYYEQYRDLMNFAGIGFELGNSGICGIDIDNCIDESGKLSPLASEIGRKLNSYTELSPSGHGLHIFCKCNFSVSKKNDQLGLEVYRPRLRTQDEKQAIFAKDKNGKYQSVDEVGSIQNGRYLTITGVAFNDVPIAERSEEIREIIEKYMPSKPKEETKQQSIDQAVRNQPSSSSSVFTGLSDREILSKMFNSKNGTSIQRLYNGDLSQYENNQSKADYNLCLQLAHYTSDPAQIDRIFRSSGLMRDKWDEMRGNEEYGERTISKALENYQHFETAQKTEPAKPEPIKIDVEDLRKNQLDYYFDHDYDQDIEAFKMEAKTGYKNLDEKIDGLYAGLYVVAAISSLGKTTFVHQMADQIAQAGNHVLYFSLEQSRLEMVSKSIARQMFIDNRNRANSSLFIRKGNKSTDIDNAKKRYKMSVSNRMSIIGGNFNCTVSYITEYINQYIKQTGVKPVVFIDYLQIILPEKDEHGRRKTTKEAIDEIITSLKKLSSDEGLTIIAISSVNRANYLTPIDFESLKESGLIEFSADCVLGLQLQCLNDHIFDSASNIKKKRQLVEDQKERNPRLIEVKILKNRYGKTGTKCYFTYYPGNDYFIGTDDMEYKPEPTRTELKKDWDNSEVNPHKTKVKKVKKEKLLNDLINIISADDEDEDNDND